MITTLDAIGIVVLFLFSLLGVIRGFIKELLSIFSWILCTLAAFMYYDESARYVQNFFPGELIPFVFSFIVIFATALLLMSIISKWVSKIVKDSPLDGLDRLLGSCFGLAKGMILVIFVAFILDFLGFEADWWDDSITKLAFEWLQIYRERIYEQLI